MSMFLYCISLLSILVLLRFIKKEITVLQTSNTEGLLHARTLIPGGGGPICVPRQQRARSPVPGATLAPEGDAARAGSASVP